MSIEQVSVVSSMICLAVICWLAGYVAGRKL